MKCSKCQADMIQAKDSWLCMNCGHLEPASASAEPPASISKKSTSVTVTPAVKDSEPKSEPTPAITKLPPVATAMHAAPSKPAAPEAPATPVEPAPIESKPAPAPAVEPTPAPIPEPTPAPEPVAAPEPATPEKPIQPAKPIESPKPIAQDLPGIKTVTPVTHPRPRSSKHHSVLNFIIVIFGLVIAAGIVFAYFQGFDLYSAYQTITHK